MQKAKRMRLLVAIDGSRAADRAASFAIAFARANAGEIVLRWVVEPGYPEGIGASKDVGETTLYVAAGKARSAGVTANTGLLLGSAPEELVKAVKDEEADLLVIGMRSRSQFEQMMLGSVSQELLRTSPVPVVIVREDMSPKH